MTLTRPFPFENNRNYEHCVLTRKIPRAPKHSSGEKWGGPSPVTPRPTAARQLVTRGPGLGRFNMDPSTQPRPEAAAPCCLRDTQLHRLGQATLGLCLSSVLLVPRAGLIGDRPCQGTGKVLGPAGFRPL